MCYCGGIFRPIVNTHFCVTCTPLPALSLPAGPLSRHALIQPPVQRLQLVIHLLGAGAGGGQGLEAVVIQAPGVLLGQAYPAETVGGAVMVAQHAELKADPVLARDQAPSAAGGDELAAGVEQICSQVLDHLAFFPGRRDQFGDAVPGPGGDKGAFRQEEDALEPGRLAPADGDARRGGRDAWLRLPRGERQLQGGAAGKQQYRQ